MGSAGGLLKAWIPREAADADPVVPSSREARRRLVCLGFVATRRLTLLEQR